MLLLAALISDPVKAGHAVQKLRERGIPPSAIRAVVRDPTAARAVAYRSQGERLAVLLTAMLAGVLAGGMAGWVLGSHIDPLSPPRDWALVGQQTTAIVGAALGLALGAIIGWIGSWLGNRRQVAHYARAVEDGDQLLVVELDEARLRDTEALLSSYGAHSFHVGPQRAAATTAATSGPPGDSAAS
jgi:hypothetical protein